MPAAYIGCMLFSSKYRPFGSAYSNTGTDTLQYSGRVYDSTMGLYYYGNRFHDPQAARFVIQDTTGVPLSDPSNDSFSAFLIS